MLRKRIVSIVMVLIMCVTLLPQSMPAVEAASNMEGGFEGQEADVYTALGFDTSVKPEGYDPNTTDNPYGKKKFTGNQVFEAMITGPDGAAVYGKNNNGHSTTDISGYPSSTNKNGLGMSAAASADFDGDGLPGEVVYVGIETNKTLTGEKLYLVTGDAKSVKFGSKKQIGTITPQSVAGEKHSWFDYAWQNLLQVTAGDYDGDGYAEIAVYVAENGNARVEVYKCRRTSDSATDCWMDMGNWVRVWSHVLSNTAGEVPNMVSLVSGDFNRDGIDDMAVSSGRFIPSTQSTGRGKVSAICEKSTATVLWGDDADMLQKDSPIDLNEKELGEQVRVSLITGDLDGDGYAELIATGQPVLDAQDYDFAAPRTGRIYLKSDWDGAVGEGNTSRTVLSYIYDESSGLVVDQSETFKPVDGNIETVTYEDGEGNSNTATNWKTNNGFDQYYYSQPVMRTNAAVVRLQGYEYTYLYIDSCMYENAKGKLSLKISLDDEKYDMENALSGSWGLKSNAAAASQFCYAEYGAVSGDINGDGYDTFLTGMTYAGYDTNHTYKILATTIEDCYPAHISGYGVLGGVDGSLQSNMTQAGEFKTGLSTNDSFYEMNTMTPVMVDVDKDTVLMEYTGEHYLTYDNPKLMAVIAAAPYFEDVDVICDYDYAWQNTTSFSKTSGESNGSLVTVDLEVGLYGTAEKEVGGGKMETEASLNYTLEWEKETTDVEEYTITFETSQDEDAVAFTCTPWEHYVYKISTPNESGGYDVTYETISNCFTPCFQVLNLDYYESIRVDYDSLPAVAGELLKSTPGDPSSYPTSTSGYDVIKEWNQDPAGVSFGNGAITQDITVSKEESEMYNMGFAQDFSIGGGVGVQCDLFQNEIDVTGGLQWSINPGWGWTKVNLNGSTFSGTVTNMPLEFQNYGYYYNWKLFAYRYLMDPGNEDSGIPVITYVVNDVSEPPKLPEDFQQDFDRTTSDKNVLTWSYDDEFSSFIIHKYYDFPVGGGLQEVVKIPSNCPTKTEISDENGTYVYGYNLKTNEDGEKYKEYYFEDCGLASYTEYEYAIQVERLTKTPPLSAPSALLSARTKASNGYPIIQLQESDGADDGFLQVYPDKNSYLTANVTGPDGEVAKNYYTTIQYQWQKLEKGAWNDVVGETGKTLTFANAGADTAGDYRCRVNVLTKSDATAISAYTNSVSLEHAKRVSYIEKETLAVTDVTGGGVNLYAKVCNAHGDSAAIPTGTVTFNVVNTATGETYQIFDELNATGEANVTVSSGLPAGIYNVNAYYSGSYTFKVCSADTKYLSKQSSGYVIDVPESVVYGEGTNVVSNTAKKTSGVTSLEEVKATAYTLKPTTRLGGMEISGASEIASGGSVTSGNKYVYKVDGRSYYFVATHTGTVDFVDGYVVYNSDCSGYVSYANDGGKYKIAKDTPADNYLLQMTYGDGSTQKSTYAVFAVTKRPITLQLPSSKINEGTAYESIKIKDVPVVDGNWATCDMSEGELNTTIADKELDLSYRNTAGKTYDASKQAELICGSYVLYAKDSDANQVDNYEITYLGGKLVVLGGMNTVTLGVREFEGKDVGTLYATAPEYDYTRKTVSDDETLSQRHAAGTRLSYTAVPDEGYAVYAWYINGVKQPGNNASISHTMMAEDTKVEVQFDVKKNTLTYGVAGDAEGGTITCDDKKLTSGSTVLPNAYMTFTAEAKEGYHFKEWRYTETGKGTVYNNEDAGKMESSFELLMPTVGCSLYAVFERNAYTFTFEDKNGIDGLMASYVKYEPGETEGKKVMLESGATVKGGTEITVEPKAGYDWDDERSYVSKGSKGVADYEKGTYVVTLNEDTTVHGYTKQGTYDVTLAFDVKRTSDQPVDAVMKYYIGEEEHTLAYEADATGENSNQIVVKDIPGGTKIKAEITYPDYYIMDGWTANATKLTATKEQDNTAVEIKNGQSVKEGTSYWYSAKDENNLQKNYYFVASDAGSVSFAGDKVTIHAEGSNYLIGELDGDDTITVHLTEKNVYDVKMADISDKGTYKLTLPVGASETNHVVTVHEGDNFEVLVTPKSGWTVTYWNIKPESGKEQETRATSLRYIIPEVEEDFVFTPVFAKTTYHAITWPTISQEQNQLMLSEYNCVASVVSGGSFSFKLSGGSLDSVNKVYANDNVFVKAQDGVDSDFTYTGDGENRIYTIKNINTDYEITVAFNDVGVKVNGTDVSEFTGDGWSYDSTTKVLTVDKANLTISGANDLQVADGFSIVVNTESVTFDNLQIANSVRANFDALVSFEGQDTILNLSGKNSIDMDADITQYSYVKADQGNLTISGNGSLALGNDSMGSTSISLYVPNGDFKVSGRCNVVLGGVTSQCINVEDMILEDSANLTMKPSKAYTAGATKNIRVGAEDGVGNPTCRVTNAETGLSVNGNLDIYAGELAVSATRYALYLYGDMETHGGILELSSDDVGNALGCSAVRPYDWKVYYDGGYMLRRREAGNGKSIQDYTKLKSAYQNGKEYDILATIDDDELSFTMDDTYAKPYSYLRLSPLDSGSTDGSITLSVDCEGITYSAKLMDLLDSIGSEPVAYIYADLNSAGTQLQVAKISSFKTPSENPTPRNIKVVAYTEISSGGWSTDLQAYSTNWSQCGDEGYMLDSYTEDETVQYDYTLSGIHTISGATGVIDANTSTVKSLTLDGLTYAGLRVPEAPVYLKGNNFLIDDRSAALGGSTINLYGDEDASITLISSQSDAINASDMNLYGIQSISAYAGDDKKAITTTDVQYFDENGQEIAYGKGWLQDAGNSAAEADVQSALNNTQRYAKFYACSSEAVVTPAIITYDKVNGKDTTEGLEDVELSVTEGTDNGVLRTFDREATSGNDTTGSVCLIDANNAETTLTKTTDYTWDTTLNKLTIKGDVLAALEKGNYTIRILYYDEDMSDATFYYSDVALKITNETVTVGDLAIDPETKIVKRGDEVELTALPTGDPVLAYEWSLSGNDSDDTTLEVSDDKTKAVLTIGDDEPNGEMKVTVTSYADVAKQKQLGKAIATITVTPVAKDIAITCIGETKSGDGSYTLRHTTPDGLAGTWDFEAEVTMDDSSQPDATKLTWSLEDNSFASTKVDATTGELTISPKETGFDGQMTLIASYENVSGEIYEKAITVKLSKESYITYDNTDATNGSITAMTADAKAFTGGYVNPGTVVVVTATPETDSHSVNNWYVNGVSVMDNDEFTVDKENHTLTFTAGEMKRYLITADYVNDSKYKVTYSADNNGTVSATSGQEAVASGSEVLHGASVVLTATPDEHCSVEKWTVDGEIYEENGVVYTGDTLTLDTITKDVDVKVTFKVAGRTIYLDDVQNGSVEVKVNGKVVTSENGEYVTNMKDVVSFTATANEGYRVKEWTVDGQSVEDAVDSYTLPADAADGTRVAVVLEAVPEHTVTVTTNSYENGSGTVTVQDKNIPMSSLEEVKVTEGNDLVLKANPDKHNYVYEWDVPAGCEHEIKDDVLTLKNVSGDVAVGVTFRRQEYQVDMVTTGEGTVKADTTLTVAGQTHDNVLTQSGKVRAGSKVTFTVEPATEARLKSVTLNGKAADVTWNAEETICTVVVEELSNDVKLEVTFAAAEELYDVVVPEKLVKSVNGKDETSGTATVDYEPDGKSTDSVADDNKVEVAQGGSAVITFTVGKEYVTDSKSIETAVQKVVDATASKAKVAVKEADGKYVVTISEVDKALDFTTMENPFKRLYTITIAKTEHGSVAVANGGKAVKNGDKVPEGTILTIKATPEVNYKSEANAPTSLKVDSNETITVKFVLAKCVVNYSALDNGTVVVKTPEGTVIENGASVDVGTTIVCVATPDEYYELDTLNVNNKAVNPSRNGNEYLYTIVTESSVPVVTIEASFVVAEDLGFDDADKFENFKVKAVGKNKSVKVTWQKIPGADGYYVYGAKCKTAFKKIKTIKNPSKVSFTQKKLKKGQYYKYKLAAYKTIDGKNYIIANSIDVHAVTKGGKYADPTKIKVNKTKVTVRKGKKATIKASYTIAKGKKHALHISKFRYESTDKTIATVNKKGVVKGVKKGTAYIYVYAQNGVYKRVKVTVK